MVQEIQNPLIPEHLLAHANLMRAINAHNGIIITQTYDKEQLRQRTDLHEVYNSGILPEALELIEITFENAEIIHTFLISNSAIIIAWFRYKTKRCIIIKNAIENTDITIQGSNDIDQAIRLCEKLKKTRDDS